MRMGDKVDFQQDGVSLQPPTIISSLPKERSSVGVSSETSKGNKSSVIEAINSGNPETLNTLLNRLSEDQVNVFKLIIENKKQFIVAAINTGHPDILKILLKRLYKGGLNIPGLFLKYKRWFITTAIKSGQPEILEALLDILHKFNINVLGLLVKNKKRFIIEAINTGNRKILEALLDKFEKYEVDISNLTVKDNEQLIIKAINTGSRRLLKAQIDSLIEAGVNVSKLLFENKNQFVFCVINEFIVDAIHAGEPFIIKALLNELRESGFDVSDLLLQNKEQFIVAAINARNPEVLEALLLKFRVDGVDVDKLIIKNKKQFIVTAIKSGHPKVLKILQETLGSKRAKDSIFNSSLVTVAIRSGHTDVLEVLLENLQPEEVKKIISKGNLVAAIHKGLAFFKVLVEKICQGQAGDLNYERLLKILPKGRLVKEVCRTGDVELMMFVFGERFLHTDDESENHLDQDAYKLFNALSRKSDSIPLKTWFGNSCAQAFLTTFQKLKSQVEIEKKQTGFRVFLRKTVNFFSSGRDSKERCLERAEKMLNSFKGNFRRPQNESRTGSTGGKKDLSDQSVPWSKSQDDLFKSRSSFFRRSSCDRHDNEADNAVFDADTSFHFS